MQAWTSEVISGLGGVERRRGVKRKSTDDDGAAGGSSGSDANSDERGENVQLSDNGSVRFEEVESASSLREFVDDGSMRGGEGAIGHAALEQERVAASADARVPQVSPWNRPGTPDIKPPSSHPPLDGPTHAAPAD
jgi:hypothetical protein